MSDRYRVQIRITKIMDVVVGADSPEEAEDCVHLREGSPGDPSPEELEIISVVKLDG